MQRATLVIGTLVMLTGAVAGCVSPKDAAAREAAYEASAVPPDVVGDVIENAPASEPPIVPMRKVSGALCTREPWDHVALDWTHPGAPEASGTETFHIPMDARDVFVQLRAPKLSAANWSLQIDGPGQAAFHSEKTEVRGDRIQVEALERSSAWSEENGWAGTYTMTWSSHGILLGFGVRVVAELCG